MSVTKKHPGVMLESDRFGRIRVLHGRVHVTFPIGYQRVCPKCARPCMMSRVVYKKPPREEWTCGCETFVEIRTFMHGGLKGEDGSWHEPEDDA